MADSRRRVLDVLAHRIPDRVPYFELLISQAVISALHPGLDYLGFCEVEDVDVVFTKWNFANRWLDEAGGIYTNEWRMIRKHGAEQTDDYLDGPIHSMEDLRCFESPDPLAQSGFRNLEEAVSRFGGRRMICFSTKATFNHIWYLMGGMEEYLVAMYTEPQLVLAINEICSAYHLTQVERALELGADMILLADDYAFRQNAFIPRDKFREFCLPAIRRMVELVHARGRHVLFHSDGKLDEFLDLIVDSGVDLLHPLEPGAMDIARAYQDYRARVVICGNVDCAHTLSFGEPQDARREVLWLLENIAPGGRFILTSSNTIHSQVRADTYRAMLDTLSEYGRYPIHMGRCADGAAKP